MTIRGNFCLGVKTAGAQGDCSGPQAKPAVCCARNDTDHRHCEERSDEAISLSVLSLVDHAATGATKFSCGVLMFLRHGRRDRPLGAHAAGQRAFVLFERGLIVCGVHFIFCFQNVFPTLSFRLYFI